MLYLDLGIKTCLLILRPSLPRKQNKLIQFLKANIMKYVKDFLNLNKHESYIYTVQKYYMYKYYM